MTTSDVSLRQRVFKLLDKNPMLTAPALCKNLGLSHEKHSHYVRNLRSHWRQMVTIGQGSFCSFSWKGWVNLPKATGPGLRAAAVKAGWVQTRALNKWLLWRDPLGRLQWFETGRVNIHLRGPTSTGRLAQVLANAFYRTGLISDMDAFEKFRKSARSRGDRVLYDDLGPGKHAGRKRLVQLVPGVYSPMDPAMDQSICIPDWAERNVEARRDLEKTLEDLAKQRKPKPVRDKEIGVV